MKIKKINNSNYQYQEILYSLNLHIQSAFKIYRSGAAIYFVSKSHGESVIGIDIDDIEATIDESPTTIIVTRIGRVVLFGGGQIFAQFYSANQSNGI